MKPLEYLSLEELWEMFPIVLTPNNDYWEEWAGEEILSLKNLLKDSISTIHHIGSTAIKGIWAKPIIDLLIESEKKDDFGKIKSILIKNRIYLRESK